MSRAASDTGLSLVEVLVSLAIFGMVMGGLASLLINDSRINRAEQMAAETQANARHCLSMITQVMRSAGWDPKNVDILPFVLDSTPLDSEQSIEVLADLDADGDTADADEDIYIRRIGTQIQWRRSSDTSQPFVVLADNITNDADGDGTAEAMFVPDSGSNPTRVLVRITARAPLPDSRTGRYFRYTVSSEVTVRKNVS